MLKYKVQISANHYCSRQQICNLFIEFLGKCHVIHLATDDSNKVFQSYLVLKLALKEPITTKVVCFSCLLKCLRNLYDKQCGPRSDCSHRSSLIWVHPVCFYVMLDNYLQQTTSAHIIFLGPLRVRIKI